MDYLDHILYKYLNKIDYYELKDNYNYIKYFYNSQPIQFEDKERIGEFFLHDNNPLVTVIDINNIINFTKLYKVIFKTNHGNILEIYMKPERTCAQLLMKYYNEIGHPELMINEQIHFLFNARQIKYGDRTTIKNCFLTVKKPVILVLDINNLLTNHNTPKITVNFNNSGNVISIIANFGTTIEQLIKMYLYKVGGKELLDDYYSQKKKLTLFIMLKISNF